MDTPTPDEVRARSPLLTARYPDPVDPAPDSPQFVAVIEDSAAAVGSITGRLIAPLTEGEEVPAGLVGVAVRAIARSGELLDSAFSAEEAEASATGRRLRSISAGPWSETYFAPGEAVMKGGRPMMSPDPTLDALLWALATEDARDEWIALATGVQPPAGAVTEFDYRRAGGGYGPSGRRLY